MNVLRTRFLTLLTTYTSPGLAKKRTPCEQKGKWKLEKWQLHLSQISLEGWSQRELLFPAWGKFRRQRKTMGPHQPFPAALGFWPHTVRITNNSKYPTTKSPWLLPKFRVTSNYSPEQQQSSRTFTHPRPLPGRPPRPFGQCWTDFCFTLNVCRCLGTAVPDSKSHRT